MIRKITLFLIPLAMLGLLASQWQDLRRYFKIKQMSMAGGIRRTYLPRGGISTRVRNQPGQLAEGIAYEASVT